VHCASVLRAIAVTPDADAGSEKINEALLQADFLLVQNSCAPKGMNHLPMNRDRRDNCLARR
jgi:hypothetical protein